MFVRCVCARYSNYTPRQWPRRAREGRGSTRCGASDLAGAPTFEHTPNNRNIRNQAMAERGVCLQIHRGQAQKWAACTHTHTHTGKWSSIAYMAMTKTMEQAAPTLMIWSGGPGGPGSPGPFKGTIRKMRSKTRWRGGRQGAKPGDFPLDVCL